MWENVGDSLVRLELVGEDDETRIGEDWEPGIITRNKTCSLRSVMNQYDKESIKVEVTVNSGVSVLNLITILKRRFLSSEKRHQEQHMCMSFVELILDSLHILQAFKAWPGLWRSIWACGVSNTKAAFTKRAIFLATCLLKKKKH